MKSVVQLLPVLRLPASWRQHGLSTMVLATMASLYLLAGINLAMVDGGPGVAGTRANAAIPTFASEQLRQAPPQPEPLVLREIAPQDAVAINTAIPVSNLANPAARAFVLRAGSDADRLRSIECLTAAVYYEAAVESADGQRAVAQVVLNRVRHPAYPSSVCGVVFQGSERSTGCQFTFTCDGALGRTPSASGWARARQVAEAALAGSVYAPVGWATHYHTNWVVPYWASSLVKAANVGTHIFYRWTGGWGRPVAFTSRYSGAEPAISRMRHLTQVPATPEEQAALAAAEAAAAPDAAAAAAATGSVDSFQRAVLRRYEPLRRDTAASMIAERTKADRSLSTSQRWALTGESSGPAAVPFGRAAPVPSTTPAAPPAATKACAPADTGC